MPNDTERPRCYICKAPATCVQIGDHIQAYYCDQHNPRSTPFAKPIGAKEMSKDGGPAFPQDVEQVQCRKCGGMYRKEFGGMSLRDYFAAKALEGESAGSHVPVQDRLHADEFARYCYMIADAMLKERERDEEDH